MKNTSTFKRFFKRSLVSVVAASAMMGGSVLTASAAHADTSITVESVSYSDATASANVTKEERALINGATQVTWENPNHNLKVTATQIKRAPKITTGCSSSNRYTQSKQIWNKTHRGIVVVKPGSCLWNRGRLGNILAGFKYYPKVPIVLMMDANHRYRHSHTLKTKSQLEAGDTVVGKVYVMGATRYIVKSCLNFIGGPVNTTITQVVQIRYESDVQLDIAIAANASVKAKVEASLQCDSGKLYGYAEATASATASASIRVKSGVKISAINAKKIELLNQVSASAKAKAEAQAKAKITLTCTDTPSYSAPSVSANASACVEQGQATGIVTVTATNNNSVAAPATFKFPGKPDQAVTIAAGATVDRQFTGVAPGSYSGSVVFGSPINKSAPYSVTVEECAPPAHQNPTAEIFVGEHAVDLYGTMPVFGRVKAFDGATATLGSPKVTPSDLGMISNWRTVSTERDGVTPCATGYVCYQGTFRVTKDGTPGTYVYGTLEATATDTKGGSFTTDPLQFSVYYANHPET